MDVYKFRNKLITWWEYDVTNRYWFFTLPTKGSIAWEIQLGFLVFMYRHKDVGKHDAVSYAEHGMLPGRFFKRFQVWQHKIR